MKVNPSIQPNVSETQPDFKTNHNIKTTDNIKTNDTTKSANMKKGASNGPSSVDCENDHHVEYDFVDEMTMDSEGVYAMPYDMESDKPTDYDYIGIRHELSTENAHKKPNLELNVNAPIKCDFAKSDAIEMYTPLSPRGIQWPRQAGNFNFYKAHSAKPRPT